MRGVIKSRQVVELPLYVLLLLSRFTTTAALTINLPSSYDDFLLIQHNSTCFSYFHTRGHP